MSNISQYYKACEHTYDLKKASRDDQGYYLDCTKCGKTEFFQCDTWDELLQLFGFDDDDYEEEEE